MRAPNMTTERKAQEAHYTAVKAIVGDLNPITGGLKKEDHIVYMRYTGTPEAVAARILAAREARGGE